MSFSILLATYNGEKYLSEQLDSLLSQTYQNFKIYISDDCSNDNTQIIIDKYCSNFPEKIIDIKNKQHFGNARDNFFNLVEKVDSDIYMFCDQDDVWLPNKIQKTYERYISVEDKSMPILIHSDLVVVDENLNIINDSFFDCMQLTKNISDWKSFLVQNYVTGCTMLINRPLAEIFKKNIALINKNKILMHDYFFALLASLFGKIEYIDQGLILYRQHGNNSVGAKNVKSLKYGFEKLKESIKGNNINIKSEEQVGEIIKIFNSLKLNEKEFNILQKYSILYKKGKFYRIFFILKNGLGKIGIKRFIFQIVTI